MRSPRGIEPNAKLRRSALVIGVASLEFLVLRVGEVRAEDAPISTGGKGGIEEITVTARKRQESQQDVPVVITAFGAEQIQQKALTNLEQVSDSVPQLIIGRGNFGSGAQLSLRGISSASTSVGVEQSVAVVMDGAYYGNGRVINEGFFDLGRLEVLKGPQSLFYGKNATAGVVSVTTADPTDEPLFLARAGHEFTAHSISGEFVASGPITDTLGVRLALRANEMFKGYYQNRGTPQVYITKDIVTGIQTAHPTAASPSGDSPAERQLLGRLTVKWKPTDHFTATTKLTGNGDHTNSAAWNMHAYACANGHSTLNAAVPCDRNFYIYQNALPLDLAALQPYASKDGSLFNTYSSWATTETVEYKIPDVTITSVSNYQWNRNVWLSDATNQSPTTGNGIWSSENNRWDAFSSELRALTSFDSPLNFLIGAYYQSSSRRLDQWTPSGKLENSRAPNPDYRYLGNIKVSTTSGKTRSAFGQAILNIGSDWELTGGARYTDERKDSFFVQPYSNPAGVAAGMWLPNTPIYANQTFKDWSPEATIKWKPTPRLMLFAAYKTAYKSGGFNNTTTEGPTTSPELVTFGPEKARGFEGGVKSTWFDRQLLVNVTGYRYRYAGLQVEAFNPVTFALTDTNAGSAVVRGAELEMQWAPSLLRGVTLNGVVNYNRSRYEQFIAPCWTGQTPSQGCNLTSSKFGPSQNLAGAPTALAPLWTASVGAGYDGPISNELWFGVSVNARYSDEYTPSQFDNPLAQQPAYVNLDASLRLHASSDRWEAAVIGKNLTNQFVVMGVVDGIQTGRRTGTAAGVPADQIGFGGLPRTVEFALTYRF